MSFGFSIGDFIAISGLILNLVDALDSNTGSSAQYARLSDELKSLHSAFLAVQDVVQKLRREDKSHTSTVNAITYEVDCCRRLILGFTNETEKYRKSLCHGGSGRKVRDTWRKISYKIFKEEDVVALKDSLRRRVDAINILLMVAGIRSVFSLEGKVSDMEVALREQRPNIPNELGCGVEGSVILQDALGRTFPVPFVVCATSEMFHDFLELSFRGLPGHKKVLSREYSLSGEVSLKEITPTEWVEAITPGRLFYMSMLFRHMDTAPKVTDFRSGCPSCRTPGAFNAKDNTHGWVQCKFCQLWAQHSKECPVKTPVCVLEPRYDKVTSSPPPPPLPLPPPDTLTVSKELSPFRRVKMVEVSRVSYFSAQRIAKELANDRKLCQELVWQLKNMGDARFVESEFLDESVVCECPCDEKSGSRGRNSHLDPYFPTRGRISEIA